MMWANSFRVMANTFENLVAQVISGQITKMAIITHSLIGYLQLCLLRQAQ